MQQPSCSPAAERQLAEVERNVANQRELVAQLERDGHDTDSATRQLEQLEEVMALHLADCDRLRRELADVHMGCRATI